MHPLLDQLFDELLSAVHSAVYQECQEVADQQAFSEGDPKHLVLAQTKSLPDSFDDGLVPKEGREGFLR